MTRWTSRTQQLFNSHLQMLLTVLIVVLANGFAAFHVARVDLSQERLYTLSEASKQLVQQMDRPIVARVYFTHGLGAPYQNHEQFVKDKLEEFKEEALKQVDNMPAGAAPGVDPADIAKVAKTILTTTFNGINLPSILLWDSAAPGQPPRVVRAFGYADFKGRLS